MQLVPHTAIKTVRRGGFTIRLWDTGRRDERGQTEFAYEIKQGRRVIYEGDQFWGSPLYADDSDETVASLLSFASHDLGKEDSALGDDLYMIGEDLGADENESRTPPQHTERT